MRRATRISMLLQVPWWLHVVLGTILIATRLEWQK
jgi:hypothetical protein